MRQAEGELADDIERIMEKLDLAMNGEPIHRCVDALFTSLVDMLAENDDQAASLDVAMKIEKNFVANYLERRALMSSPVQ